MKNNHPVELSKLLTYLAKVKTNSGETVPTLAELSQELGMSISTVREQLEAARLLGIVDVKPKSGIKLLPYAFKPAVLASLTYAIESGAVPFSQFSDLRKHLEAAYFVEAATLLSKNDLEFLSNLVRSAQSKIKQIPGQIPVPEHREFHLCFYKKLENPFLMGIFESYWDLYRIAGLEIYPDMAYIDRVWHYHGKIIEQVQNGNFNQGLKLLLEHMDLINQRERVFPRLSFE